MKPRLKKAAVSVAPSLTLDQVAQLLPERFRILPTNQDDYCRYASELDEALRQITSVVGPVDDLDCYHVMPLLGTSPADYFYRRFTG